MKVPTGDKAYYQNMLLKMIAPLKAHYSKSGASLNLNGAAASYGGRIAGMEGFSRVLWGLVSYLAGGGMDVSLVPLYIKGFENGTNQASEAYWGDLHDKDQRMVEMAAIAYGILMTPEQLWKPLTNEGKNHLAAWLGQMNEYQQADNNWQFFNVIVNLALKSVGRAWDQERLEYAISRFEAFYIGNGWYSDGVNGPKDYYVSFGIHFYCLLYAHFMKRDDPERSSLYCRRARVFAQTFIYWFDDEGKALPFGRSQTYRFAQIAFFSGCVLAGEECLPYGVIKGMIRRHMDYWLRQPIFDNGDVLTVGYTYPNLLMSEGYNAPGSPYWSLKAFVFLALPDEHEFWHVKEQPLPALLAVKAIPECNMILTHRPYEVTALTAGQYPRMEHPHSPEKYSKFAYSSRFGFCVPRSYRLLEQAGTDSMLAFYVHDMYYVRSRCLDVSITESYVYSKWSPTAGIEVETWLYPTANGHLRRHRVSSERECVAYDCGFSYPRQMDCMDKSAAPGSAIIRDENGRSVVFSEQGEGLVITCFPNANLIYPNSCIPAIVCQIPIGIKEWETTVETEFINHGITIGGSCYEVCSE